jgi:hypothetical protein
MTDPVEELRAAAVSVVNAWEEGNKNNVNKMLRLKRALRLGHEMGPPHWEPGCAQDEWVNRCIACDELWPCPTSRGHG